MNFNLLLEKDFHDTEIRHPPATTEGQQGQGQPTLEFTEDDKNRYLETSLRDAVVFSASSWLTLLCKAESVEAAAGKARPLS